jgi:hypothetical protein
MQHYFEEGGLQRRIGRPDQHVAGSAPVGVAMCTEQLLSRTLSTFG